MATLPTLIHVEPKWTSGSSTSLKPPSPANNYPYYKKDQTLPLPPNTPPIDAYIMATELASSKLPTQEVEEFRSDVNRLLKQQQQHNRHCNLNPAQCRALTQLKQDSTRVVFTVDKGVAMVIMDQQDYNKAQALLQDTNTYKVLPKDPTPNSKTNLSPYLKASNKQEASVPKNINNCIPPVQSHPNFRAYPKYIKLVPPSDPQYPVGGPSHMG